MNLAKIKTLWMRLRYPEPAALVETRLQLHHAAQLVGAVGRALADPQADDSHTSLEWLDQTRLLAGQPVQGSRNFRAALRPADLTLVLLEEEGETLASLPLAGRTNQAGLAWLQKEATRLGAQGDLITPETPYDLPAHPVARGRPYDLADREGYEELARHFANAATLLRELAATTPGAGPVRCWPHHFDIATLVLLDPQTGEQTRSIGVGLSPGDDSYGEPYWYILPWPAPGVKGLPEWQGSGGWHTRGWVGGVLRASEVVTTDSAEGQGEMVVNFYEAGLATTRSLLER